jgi:alpha-ketoglutarate-dependent sulfate ester dioxygenase
MTALQESTTIVVRPVAGHIGADISGVDIAGPLAPETVRQLKDALHKYKVIFFRDQHLDHASQRSSPSTHAATSSGTARTSAS